MYYYILYMSYYPLLNYNWKDTSGNILPIANNYFAYGTLGEVPNNASSNGLWYSLKVDKVFNANSPSKIVDVYPNNLGNGLTFNVSGIYQITTTLQFSGSGTTRQSGMFTLQRMYTQNFAFSYSTAVNRAKNLSTRVNEMAGPIARTPLNTTSPYYTPTNFDTTPTPYFISGFASGGSTNGFDTTNCGGNVCLWKNNSPFFILPNYMSAANTSNVNTITALYYIPAGQTIYFNISDTVSSSGNPASTLTATGNFTVTLLNTNKALGYPLYNWIPTNYSTFVYGTLNQRTDYIVGSAWGSLLVNSTLYGGTNNVVSLNNTGLKFNVSGFYQLTTNLDLMADNNNITSGVKPFVFAYSTVSNTNIGFSYYNNWIRGPIAYFNNTTTFDTTKPYFITGKSCGGNANFSNGFESVSYGGNIGLATNKNDLNSNIPMYTIPFFILPNYHDGSSLLADNINTINAIYYIPADTTLYFNIGCDSTLTGTKMFNANGNFTVNLLSTIGSVNNFPLLNYNWTKSSNKYPIVNSCFVYGTIGKIFGYGNGTSVGDGLDWDSLRVNSIDGTSIATTNAYSSVTSMNNLVTSIKNFNPSFSTTESYATYGLKFNVSGIYQITTTLQFTGTNDSGSQQITSGVQTFAFSYSKAVNFASTTSIAATGTADRLSSSRNEILGPITVFDGSSSLSTTPYFINGSASGGGSDLTNGFDSTYFGGNICMLPNATTTSTLYPPFFIMPNYMTTPTNEVNVNVNVNTINAIYYIPAGTNIYFNIANTTQRDWLNANGNFTIKLLNYVPNFVTNNTNLTVSPLQQYGGYNYYTFFPTNTNANGTATITILTSASINYLLVGGGGGGGGSYNSSGTNNGGGGGGGGQIRIGTTTGGQITITVGNAGSGGVAAGNGGAGGNTVLNTIIAAGGGGGGTDTIGGTGGSAAGGQGYMFQPLNVDGDQGSMPGGAGQSINISQIGLTYSVGGAGGGGGPGGGPGSSNYNTYNGGAGGVNNVGGVSGGSTNYNGTNSTGYGTGGGGGGSNYGFTTSYLGGSGGSGFAVLYWEA
jgi:hypothetical protein